MTNDRLNPRRRPADDVQSAERIHGIDEPLPDGERVLWQGTPAPFSLGRRAFHANAIVLWFAALALWQIASTRADGAAWGTAFAAALPLTGPLVAGVVIVLGLALWSAYTSTYAITDRRIVLRVGMVLPITFNVPLALVESASVRRHRDGTGDIAVALAGKDRIAYAVLWPHARAWRFSKPEPSLRCIADLDAASTALASALTATQVAAVAEAGVPAPRGLVAADGVKVPEAVGLRPRADGVVHAGAHRADERVVPIIAGGHA